MIKKLNLGNYALKLIYRHQWDKQLDNDKFDKWNEKKLGIWWKFYKNKFQTELKLRHPLLDFDGVMIGLNLIWLNVWIDFGKKMKFRKTTFKYKRKL